MPHYKSRFFLIASPHHWRGLVRWRTGNGTNYNVKVFYKKMQSAKEALREVRKLLPSKEIVGYYEVDVK